MLKNTLTVLALAFTLLSVSGHSAMAQEFDKGFSAYEAGDYQTAIQEWRPLAEQGNAFAQTLLAGMYFNGEFVAQDNVYAYMWYDVSASLDYPLAVLMRDAVAEQMTAAEVSKAQELARECVKKNYKGC